jgi:hypothetical protein
MDGLFQEMLFCELALTCETTCCGEYFEPDEAPAEPMEAWAARGAAVAEGRGWKVGHTGLVKCPKCAAAAPG